MACRFGGGSLWAFRWVNANRSRNVDGGLCLISGVGCVVSALESQKDSPAVSTPCIGATVPLTSTLWGGGGGGSSDALADRPLQSSRPQ
jgi:hypothetical protein